MKLFFDENLSPGQARHAGALGHDAVAAVEVGLGGQPDDVNRQYAISKGRILITLDADFANVTRYPVANTPGVIRLRIHSPTEKAISEAVSRALAALGTMSVTGKMVVVDEQKIRMRAYS